MTERREGFSMIEALLSIILGALLVGAAWMGVARERVALENMTRRSEWLSSVRMSRTALARDIAGGAGRFSASADTVGFRVVRGVGFPCLGWTAGQAPTSLSVSYSGIRAPNAQKDSVRVLSGDGDWSVGGLVEVWPDARCDRAGGEKGLRLEIAIPVEGSVYAEIFETGSYHLTAHALRYRGPAGNRQPLTPENVASTSRFGPRGRTLELVPSANPASEPWVLSLEPWWRP